MKPMKRMLGLSLALVAALAMGASGRNGGSEGNEGNGGTVGNGGNEGNGGNQGNQGNGGNQGNHHGKSHAGRTLLEWSRMFGVDGAFVGDTNPVDEIPGDELPWEISSARGKLDTDGDLFLAVRGVVFKDDPSVPPDLRGINDETEFRAAVSCLTETNGAVVQSTVMTEGFPANEQGDSIIRAHVTLPDPCIAPAVFVLAGSEDKWFAVTGFETEEEEAQ